MGLDAARAFAASGAAVVLSDVNEQALRAATDELTAAGHGALGVTCDVADEAQVAALVDRTVEEFGRLDMAFNNAGMMLPLAGAAEEPDPRCGHQPSRCLGVHEARADDGIALISAPPRPQSMPKPGPCFRSATSICHGVTTAQPCAETEHLSVAPVALSVLSDESGRMVWRVELMPPPWPLFRKLVPLPCRRPAHKLLDLQGISRNGASRDRTGDLLLAKQALSQLSYGPFAG